MMRRIKFERSWAARGALAATLVALVAVAAGCGSSSSGSGGGEDKPKEVTIGASLPLTGPGAVYGKGMREGLQAGVEAVNSGGGAGGSKLKVVYLDSKAEAAPAVANMRQLTESDDAVAVATAFSVPPLAQLPLAERSEVAILNGGGNDPSLLGHEWLFNDVVSVSQEEHALFEWLKANKGVKTLGLIVSTAFSEEGQQLIIEAAEEVLGKGNVTSTTMDEASTDATAPIEKALANNPDALFTSVSGAPLELTLKQLAERGVSIPVSTGSQIFSLPPSTFSGSIGSQLVVSRQEFKPSSEFLKAVGGSKSELPSLYVGTYYTLGLMLGKAVENLNEAGEPVNGANVHAQLEELGEVEGCCGQAGFTEDHGSTAGVEIVTFPNGQEKVVETVAAK
jgi:branched-chain amino acid transport system substrate-binding protein